ncbi:MAG: hypothetical protein EHM38_00615 [Geobacteraceae bacterium]|nr:MAG: hypothetical protein EHM38_00615 [Geobacteraceae bacterium]
MTRSRKKTPITGITTAESEKAEKLAAHKRERRRVRQTIQSDPNAEILPHTREWSSPWLMAKDGKIYHGARVEPKVLRK